MAEPIDPSAIPGGEPDHDPAELSGSLWQGETEIPGRLGNSLPVASGHGWLTTAVIVGVASLVLAVGGMIAWRNPTLQTATNTQPGHGLAPASHRNSAPGGLPVNRPSRDVLQASSTERGSNQPRQPAFTPATAVAPESPAGDSHLPSDDKQLGPSELPLEADAGAMKSASAYRRAINRARAAFVARDLKRAQRQLELAAEKADSPGHKVLVAQFRALGTQLDHFWAAVRAGLAALEPAEELDIEGAIAAVVESGPESLTLFVTGSRRDYTLANLPTKVALFVAGRGGNENAPVNQVCWGAFYAVDPRADRTRARQLWESAAAAGESVDDLLPFLDPRALVIEREPVPDTLELAPAEGAIEKKFADAIAAGKSAPRKSQLAADLISAAADAETSLEHYALLKQAARWAIVAAEPQAALQAIDEQARWFKVDAWTLKSAALAEAAASSTSTASAKQIATSALQLSDEAEAQSLREQAQALAVTAQAAARKARDRELIKKTAQRRHDVEQLGRRRDTTPSASE